MNYKKTILSTFLLSVSLGTPSLAKIIDADIVFKGDPRLDKDLSLKTTLDPIIMQFDINKDGVFNLKDDFQIESVQYTKLRDRNGIVDKNNIFFDKKKYFYDEQMYLVLRYKDKSSDDSSKPKPGDKAPPGTPMLYKNSKGFYFLINKASNWTDLRNHYSKNVWALIFTTAYPSSQTNISDDYEFYLKTTPFFDQLIAGKVQTRTESGRYWQLYNSLELTEAILKDAENNGLTKQEWSATYPIKYPENGFPLDLYNFTRSQKQLAKKYFPTLNRNIHYGLENSEWKLSYKFSYELSDYPNVKEWKEINDRLNKIDLSTPVKIIKRKGNKDEVIHSDQQWIANGYQSNSNNGILESFSLKFN